MFFRATIASTSARTSGSEVGYGPAPSCSPSGAQSAGQLRFRSRPSSTGAIVTLTPSQFWIVPSGKTRKNSPSKSSGWRATSSRAIVRVRLPGAVRVAEAHHQQAPVAVDVLAVEPVLRLLARVRANARAAEAPVGEPRVRAVRVHARDDVERARVERVRHPLVVAVPVQEPVEEVQRRGRAGELHRVDLGVDEDRRLLLRRPRLEVRHRREPDLAAFVRLADRLEREQARETRRPRRRASPELGVRVEAIEADARRHWREPKELPCGRARPSGVPGRVPDPRAHDLPRLATRSGRCRARPASGSPSSRACGRSAGSAPGRRAGGRRRGRSATRSAGSSARPRARR